MRVGTESPQQALQTKTRDERQGRRRSNTRACRPDKKKDGNAADEGAESEAEMNEPKHDDEATRQ